MKSFLSLWLEREVMAEDGLGECVRVTYWDVEEEIEGERSSIIGIKLRISIPPGLVGPFPMAKSSPLYVPCL